MILIGLGANLPSTYGSPEDSLNVAARLLAERGLAVLKTSGVWSTAPVPASDQPRYKNAVLAVHSELSPTQVLSILKSVEDDMGREERLERNAARIIDLDLLAYGNYMLDGPVLALPHPRMHRRGFVLYPLREIAPHWRHPVLGLSVDEMIKNLPDDQRLEIAMTIKAA